MSQIRQLASQTLVYGVSSVLGRVLNYLLVPLYTAVFNPEEYGIVTELYAYVAFLNILYTYGFETAYFRFTTKSDNGGDYYHIAQTSLIITSVLFSGLIFLFSDSLAMLLDYPDKGIYIKWLALILAVDAVIAVPFARLRLENKALKFAGYKLFNIGLNISLNLFFLVLCPDLMESGRVSLIADIYNPDLGVGYVFLSNLIANGSLILLFSPYLIRLNFRINKDWLPMIMYAAPLMVMGFAGATNEMLSRALLKYWLPEGFYPDRTNLEILGIFGACYKLSVFMTLAVQAFRYAFEPFFFAKSQDKDSKNLFAQAMHGFIIFGCLAWLVISIFLPDIAPIFLRKESYLSGLEIVPWLLGGGLFLGIYYNLSVWYKLTDKTSYGAWITVGGAVVTVILNLTLIPLIGYMGSAVTTFFAYLIMTIVSFLLGRKYYPVPYHVGRGSFYLIITAGLIGAFYFCAPEGLLRYLLAISITLFFLLMVWWKDLRTGFIRIKRT